MDKKRKKEDDKDNAASGAKRLCSQPGASVHAEGHQFGTKPHIGLKEVRCKKHPGHVKFMSVPDFKEFHLPLVENPEVRELLKAVITLTVRLRVGYTSFERDDEDDDASYRGTRKGRHGTGFVTYVKYQDHCSIMKCPERNNEKHYGFLVRTSRHVVYNTEEARETYVDFNYDDDKKMDQQMTSLKGTEEYKYCSDHDLCTFWTNTHEEELGEVIYNATKVSYYSKPQRYALSKVIGLSLNSEPVIIVSHPHERAKYVTFGKFKCNDKKFPGIAYDAPTCPGSSGALVLRYEPKNPELLKQYIHLAPVHWGGYEDGSCNFANWYWWRKRF